jgi:hypothetical protein
VFNPWNEEGRRGKRSAGAAQEGGGNRWWGLSPALVQKEEEGVGWAEWGEKSKQTGWLAGPTGPKSEENFFSE